MSAPASASAAPVMAARIVRGRRNCHTALSWTVVSDPSDIHGMPGTRCPVMILAASSSVTVIVPMLAESTTTATSVSARPGTRIRTARLPRRRSTAAVTRGVPEGCGFLPLAGVDGERGV